MANVDTAPAYHVIRRMKRPLRTVLLVLALVAVFVVGYVRLPYYSLGPGPAREVEPLIDVQGRPSYPSSGKLIMTTVSYRQLTPALAFLAWLDPARSIVHRDVLYPANETPEAEHQRALSDMDESKIDAAYVVLSRLDGYPGDHGKGALIETTYAGCPADGKLHAGDLITSIDAQRVTTAADASKILSAAKTGDPITFEVHAAGETSQIDVAKGTCPGSKKPLFGVSIVNSFPFSVNISSGDIGGPSAGLMFALGLYDLLTPGDLTQGRTIAGTGTIGLDGKVGPIGGIADKVEAARRVGATVFLAPKDNMAELKDVDVGDMKVIPVGTFQQALDALSATA
jgi:PDZ domain-containing protein